MGKHFNVAVIYSQMCDKAKCGFFTRYQKAIRVQMIKQWLMIIRMGFKKYHVGVLGYPDP